VARSVRDPLQRRRKLEVSSQRPPEPARDRQHPNHEDLHNTDKKHAEGCT
jgi:hypothetical protein